jgi:hypothetical protein
MIPQRRCSRRQPKCPFMARSGRIRSELVAPLLTLTGHASRETPKARLSLGTSLS